MDSKKILQVNEKQIELFKAIINKDNLFWFGSSYGGDRFGFNINKSVYREYRYFLSGGYSIFEKLVMIVCRCHPISKYLSYQLNLSEKDIALIRTCYFEINDVIGEKYLTLGIKRPFGNTNIISDFKKIYNEVDDNDVYNEMISKLEKVISYLLYIEIDKDLEIVEYDFYRYELSNSYIRKKKIEKLFK